MENKTQQMDVIDVSKQKTEEGKQELYLYSLRKMAEDNVEHNRNPQIGRASCRERGY